ncbi:MAG: hypothetical protein EXQ81_11135 [Thermoleophilia bacterium]|nr:hypothetical protein [Thermoleophilia bacterium]
MTATEQRAHGSERDPELVDVIRELSDRIEALKADVRRLDGPGLPASVPGWNDESDDFAPAPSFAWMSSVGAPVRRRPGVPRLLLEVLFLAAVAAAAAVAKLDAPVIAGVMVVAWALVALIEWAGSRAERRREAIPTFAPARPAEAPVADPSWFVPPVEHTLLEPASNSPTSVTKLPPAPQDLEATVERPPGR